MRTLEKDELLEIHGGLNLLIKIPVITSSIALASMYYTGYFEDSNASSIPVPVTHTPTPIAPSNSPSSIGQGGFLTVGQPEKRSTPRVF